MFIIIIRIKIHSERTSIHRRFRSRLILLQFGRGKSGNNRLPMTDDAYGILTTEEAGLLRYLIQK